MPRKGSIFEDHHPEAGQERIKDETLLKEMISDSDRFAPPDDPSEMIWTGGNDPININDWLEYDLEDVRALDNILLAIIRKHSDFEWPLDPDTPEGKRVQNRLNQAKKALTNQPIPSGKKPTIERQLVWQIAERYWLAYANKTTGVTLASIAQEVVIPNWRKNGHDYKEVESEARPYIEAFKKDHHRLLLRVSAKGLDEVESRPRIAGLIIDQLCELGLAARDS